MLWSSCVCTMARLGFPPVALQCQLCQRSTMTWPCYKCGGTYCGFCAERHGDTGTSREELDRGGVDFANEVAEGMHWFWRRMHNQSLASEIAADPAIAAMHSRNFTCE